MNCDEILFRSLPVPALLIDAREGTLSCLNDAAAEIFDAEFGEGTPVSALFPDFWQQSVLERVRSDLERDGISHYTCACPREDALSPQWEISIGASGDSQFHWVLTLRDVRHQINFERAYWQRARELNRERLQQRQLLGALFEHAPFGILLLDGDMCIEDGNSACTMLLRCAPGAHIGTPIAQLIPQYDPEAALGTPEVRTLPRGRNADSECRLRVISTRLRSAHFDNYLLIVEDVTRIERTRQRMQEQEALLIQQNKMASVGEMLAAINHQWRQPLASLSLYFENLQDELDEGLPDLQSAQDILRDGLATVDFMNQTMEQFSRFFVPSPGHHVFDVRRAIDLVVNLLGPQCRNQGIRIDYHSDVQTAPLARGACNELQQVLLNLIGNARDELAGRTPEDPGRIEVGLSMCAGQISISVDDNAGGIRCQMLPVLFDNFVTTKGDQGSGIGLYLSRLIVEDRFGGSLLAGNTDDGARFRILLPLQQPTQEDMIHGC